MKATLVWMVSLLFFKTLIVNLPNVVAALLIEVSREIIHAPLLDPA